MPTRSRPSRIVPIRSATRTAVAPTFQESLHELLKDGDDLTRRIASGLAVAARFEVEDHDGVDAVEKMLHLKALPIFDELTARVASSVSGDLFATEQESDTSDEAADRLGKLTCLSGVKEYPMRVKCATLAWHTLAAALEHSKNPVTTE